MPRDEALYWVKRFAAATVTGVIDLAVLLLVFYFALPSLIATPSLAAGELEYSELLAGVEGGVGIIIAAMYLLNIAARGLSDTLLSPIFRSSALILGFMITLAYVGSGTISITQNIGDATVEASIDISPLIATILGFIVLPGILLHFITYLVGKSSRP